MPANPYLPMNPTLPTNPTPTVVTTMATLIQMPVTWPATTTAKSIPMTVYNLAQGKFKGIPYPTRRSQEEGGPSYPSSNNPMRSSNPKLKPLPQPHKPERKPIGQTLCQSVQIYLLKGHHGQSSLWWWSPKTHLCQSWKSRGEDPTKQAAITHALVLNKPQNDKPAEEEC